MTKHLVVIGGVAAGTKVSAKVRREDDKRDITIFTMDQHISYAGCGLPYYIGDDIKTQEELLVNTPEDFKTKFNIDVKIKHKVTKIDPKSKEVIVLNLDDNTEKLISYDDLVIATGAAPFKLPIEGIELNNIFNLRNVRDAVAIKEKVDSGSVKKALIVGGGLIGIEAAEGLVKRGVEVTVIELYDHILGLMDKDIACIAETHCKQKGVNVITSDAIVRFDGDPEGNVCKAIGKNHEFDVDMVLVTVGVKPNTTVAIDAGVELGVTKAIKVDKHMRTNLPNVYAAGDCVESTNIITGLPVWSPLGSVANKQGRVAAINIVGGDAEFEGVLGSVIVKVFDLTVCKTGLSEKEAKINDIDYVSAKVTGKDIAGYYPGAKDLTIKLLADKATRKIIGCEIIGDGRADKRIDVVAMAITGGMKVDEFINTDLAYAPPYSPAIDPIQVAASMLLSKF